MSQQDVFIWRAHFINPLYKFDYYFHTLNYIHSMCSYSSTAFKYKNFCCLLWFIAASSKCQKGQSKRLLNPANFNGLTIEHLLDFLYVARVFQQPFIWECQCCNCYGHNLIYALCTFDKVFGIDVDFRCSCRSKSEDGQQQLAYDMGNGSFSVVIAIAIAIAYWPLLGQFS